MHISNKIFLAATIHVHFYHVTTNAANANEATNHNHLRGIEGGGVADEAAIPQGSTIGGYNGIELIGKDDIEVDEDDSTMSIQAPHSLWSVEVKDFHKETEKASANNGGSVMKEISTIFRRLTSGGGHGRPPYCSEEDEYCYMRYDCCYGLRCDDPFTTKGKCIDH